MADQSNNQPQEQQAPQACIHLESVNRISKLPVVESTIQTASNIYEKVKDMNSVTNWSLSTAEATVQKVVEVGKPIAAPVIKSLDGPIKTVDKCLCTGLDYIEAKVPAVKLPPGEIYNNTKEFVSNNAAVQTARHMVEPAVISAKNAVEPIVQPAVEKAMELLHMDKKGRVL